VARLSLERASGGIAVRQDLQGRLALEFGEGPGDYVRATASGRWLTSLGESALLSRVYLGAGSDRLPPHRGFAIGGRGTLVGEPFRAYGGRNVALAHLEWRFELPVPALKLGSFASTGRRMTLAPFVSAGYAGQPQPGLPWRRTGGIRPVAGVALEWFMRLFRLEAGVGLRDGGVGVTVDVNRDWWGLL
jgi:outer membrane protein assembly factor BamA